MNNFPMQVSPFCQTGVEIHQCTIADIAQTPVVVVAPHPDDETLGCGGAIALLKKFGCQIEVVVVSDGTGSHPHSRKYPRIKLRKLRELETLTALTRLGLEPNSVTFWRLEDGAVSSRDESAIAYCKKYLAKFKPKLLILPWRFDPHSDHRASWEIMQIGLQALSMSPRQLEYPIWDWDINQRGNIPQSLNIKTWQLDISSSIELKQHAITAYRSQITNLIDDDPAGFRLSAQMLTNFAHPWEIYLEEIR